ncbi:hypothetical protein CONPUDRAFT_37341, partial [Coniophora puteana RWD-64-598 SS2]
RRAGQTTAHAMVKCRSPEAANALLRDGVVIDCVKYYPTKDRRDPMRCAKCQQWGHLAAKCQSPTDVCGTCGDAHRTKSCPQKEKRHCVSCKSGDHASWDRSCPEFIRHKEALHARFPEDDLPYFPTGEQWT